MVDCILLSGGLGSRMKQRIPKQYLMLCGKPIIVHSLEKINKVKGINNIILVCDSFYTDVIKKYLLSFSITKNIIFAKSGINRQESVFSGLKYVTTDKVIIHESARPFIDVNDFEKLLLCDGNAIFGSKIDFTVVIGKKNVENLLERDNLTNVQLPQIFETKLIKDSYKLANKEKNVFTEDSSLIKFYNPNIKIKILEGKIYNIKITNPIDLAYGEAIYKEYFLGKI